MTDNVVKLPGICYSSTPAVDMLRNIADGEPKHAFVIAWPADGKLPAYYSSTGDLPIVMLRIQEFIHKFYNGDFETK